MKTLQTIEQARNHAEAARAVLRQRLNGISHMTQDPVLLELHRAEQALTAALTCFDAIDSQVDAARALLASLEPQPSGVAA